MDQYAGLDAALKETSISIAQNRKRIWRGKCLSDPQLVAEMIRKHAPYAVLVVLETGPPTWFHRKPADGLKAAGIDARHAKAARDTASHKTGANDADGLSLLAKAGSSGRFAATGARHRMSLISAISSRGHMRFMIKQQGGVNADVFIEFLKRLIAGAKHEIFLIVDRGAAHIATKRRTFVETLKGKLRLFYLLPIRRTAIPTSWCGSI